MNKGHVAIDGPSGAGKSTVARELAKRLGIVYVDTGAMYRAIGLKATRLNINRKDGEALSSLLQSTTLGFSYKNGAQRVLLDGEDVEDAIRTPEASLAAADVSATPQVRRVLVDLQRAIAEKQSVVMDGRDIGEHVLPDARYKFYITASSAVRAKRRFDELTAKGEQVAFEKVLSDIIARDAMDSSRAVSPLRPAASALIINTDALSVEQILDIILSHMEGKQ